MKDELLKRIIEELAQALLYREYGKDMKNEHLIRLLAEGSYSEFAARVSIDG